MNLSMVDTAYILTYSKFVTLQSYQNASGKRNFYELIFKVCKRSSESLFQE